MWNVRRALRSVAVGVVFIQSSWSAFGQSTFFDNDIPVRSVVAISYPIADKHFTSGMGVYVGNSQVYTAAHIFENLQSPNSPIDVLVIDHFLRPVRHIKARLAKFNADSDAAILLLDEAAGLKALPACEEQNPKGSALIFVRFQGFGDAPITAWEAESRQLWGDVLTREQFLRGSLDHGYSGGPALYQAGECFVGVVSRVDRSTVTIGGIFPTQTSRSRTKLVPVSAFTSKMQEVK